MAGRPGAEALGWRLCVSVCWGNSDAQLVGTGPHREGLQRAQGCVCVPSREDQSWQCHPLGRKPSRKKAKEVLAQSPLGFLRATQLALEAAAEPRPRLVRAGWGGPTE